MFILCRAHGITPTCLKLKSKSGQEARHMSVLNVLDEIGEGMTLKRVSDVEEGADVVALLRLHLNNSRCHLQFVTLVWPLASAQLL